MDGTFQATAGFVDSDMFQKAVQMALRSCILSVNSDLSGIKFSPGPTLADVRGCCLARSGRG